jgi:RNA processing factor Prp31
MEIKPSKIFRITLDTSYTINGMSLLEADEKMCEELGEFFTEEMKERGNVALNGDNVVYIRDNGYVSDNFYNVVKKYYESTIEDVSEIIIKDNSLLSDMDDYCREYSYKMFEEFRKDYSSTDDVLDKIIENGIDYIDDIDKEILKTKNPS